MAKPGTIKMGGAAVEVTVDDQTAGQLGTIQDRFKAFESETRQTFGARGALKGAFEILLGGGAIAGVTYAANAIRNAADAISELNAQFASGELSAKAYWSEVVRGLPVLGSLTKMFDSIGDAITGNLASLNSLQTTNEKITGAFNDFEKAMGEAAKRLKEIAGGADSPALKSLDEAIAKQAKFSSIVLNKGKGDFPWAAMLSSPVGAVAGYAMRDDETEIQTTGSAARVAMLENQRAALAVAEAQTFADQKRLETFRADVRGSEERAKASADATAKYVETMREAANKFRDEIATAAFAAMTGMVGGAAGGAGGRTAAQIAEESGRAANEAEFMRNKQREALENQLKNLPDAPQFGSVQASPMTLLDSNFTNPIVVELERTREALERKLDELMAD